MSSKQILRFQPASIPPCGVSRTWCSSPNPSSSKNSTSSTAPPAPGSNTSSRSPAKPSPTHPSHTFQPITFEEQRQAMIDVGLPEAVADDNARAVALMAEGDCDYTTDNVPAVLGRPARSFEKFATHYAAAFSPNPSTHRSADPTHSANEVAAPNQSRSQRAPSPKPLRF